MPRSCEVVEHGGRLYFVLPKARVFTCPGVREGTSACRHSRGHSGRTRLRAGHVRGAHPGEGVLRPQQRPARALTAPGSKHLDGGPLRPRARARRGVSAGLSHAHAVPGGVGDPQLRARARNGAECRRRAAIDARCRYVRGRGRAGGLRDYVCGRGRADGLHPGNQATRGVPQEAGDALSSRAAELRDGEPGSEGDQPDQYSRATARTAPSRRRDAPDRRALRPLDDERAPTAALPSGRRVRSLPAARVPPGSFANGRSSTRRCWGETLTQTAQSRLDARTTWRRLSRASGRRSAERDWTRQPSLSHVSCAPGGSSRPVAVQYPFRPVRIGAVTANPAQTRTI